MNRSLRALLTERDKARRDLEERVVSNVKQLVVPYINKLMNFTRNQYASILIDSNHVIIYIHLKNLYGVYE